MFDASATLSAFSSGALRADEVKNAADWNTLLLKFPSPHPMQTWQWGAAREALGDRVFRWLISEGDVPVLAAQVFVRRLRHVPISVAWVPRGPAYADHLVAERGLRLLRKPLRALGCRVLVVQPYSHGQTQRLLYQLLRREEFTFIVDLNSDLHSVERLLRNKGINRFLRESGKVTQRTDEKATDALRDLYAKLVDRKGFRPYGGSGLIREVWESFRKFETDQIQAFVYQADIAGRPASSAMVLRIGSSAHYLWAAADHQMRNLGAGEAMQWQIMSSMRSIGVRFYDLEGADRRGNPGVYMFKQKLGGTLVKRSRPGFLLL